MISPPERPASNDPYWSPLVPELTVGHLDTALRFYAAAGFTLRFRRETPPFAYLELGQAQLMLVEDHGSAWNVAPLERPLGRGVNFQIEVVNLGEVSQNLQMAGFFLFDGPSERWYASSAEDEEGQVELLFHDPDGYLMRFVQVVGSRRRTG